MTENSENVEFIDADVTEDEADLVEPTFDAGVGDAEGEENAE